MFFRIEESAYADPVFSCVFAPPSVTRQPQRRFPYGHQNTENTLFRRTFGWMRGRSKRIRDRPKALRQANQLRRRNSALLSLLSESHQTHNQGLLLAPLQIEALLNLYQSPPRALRLQKEITCPVHRGYYGLPFDAFR